MSATREGVRLGGNGRAIGPGLAMAAIGFAALGVGFTLDPREALFAYLTALAFALSVCLGALALVMIGHAAGATWIVAVRRPIELAAAALPLFALLFVPIALRLPDLYPWAAGGALSLSPAKRAYLSAPLTLARAGFYFAVWSALSMALWRWSLQSDRAPALGAISRSRVLSAVGFPALGLTVTFASFDWIMSLEPAWSSSMFGIYYFAGGFLGALALSILLVSAWWRAGLLPAEVGADHGHALGKLLLTAVIFWAYVAFFQGMLIWIANIPKEASWLVLRTRGGWGEWLLFLGAAQFALPFAALLSRSLKRRRGALGAVAALVLAAHYADIYWLVMPDLHAEVRLSWQSPAALLAVVGSLAAFTGWLSRGVAGAPCMDPRLPASLAYRTGS